MKYSSPCDREIINGTYKTANKTDKKNVETFYCVFVCNVLNHEISCSFEILYRRFMLLFI